MAAEPCGIPLRERFLDDLRESDADVDSVIRGAKREATPDSLSFAGCIDCACMGGHTATWSTLTTGLADLGLAFGDVVFDGSNYRRVLAHDGTEALVTRTTKSAGIKHGRKALTRSDAVPSQRDQLIRILETKGPSCADDVEFVTLAESTQREMKKWETPTGLYFTQAARFAWIKPAPVFFSWESMTTGLRGRGYAFGDVVDGRRAIAFRDGDLWVARSAPRVDVVEKM